MFCLYVHIVVQCSFHPNLIKIRVKRALDYNVDIQTKQVVKQLDEKNKFSFKTHGTWSKRNAEFIRYQEVIDDATVTY